MATTKKIETKVDSTDKARSRMSFKNKLEARFRDKLQEKGIYRGEATYQNPFLEKQLRVLGCQDPSCRNYDNFMAKQLSSTLQGIPWDDRDVAVEIHKPSVYGGLPVSNCSYCQGTVDPVEAGLLEEGEAMEIIERLRNGESLIVSEESANA